MKRTRQVSVRGHASQEGEDLMPTAKQLLARFNDSKTLPHVALRLANLLSDESSRIQEFEELIKMDPVLVSRLLRMVNSPYYGVREKISSISRAIVFMGMKNLRNLVVVEGLKGAFQKRSPNHAFSREKLWLHCVAVSICSEMMVERIFGQRGEDAFLCGILHDIGLIVEDQTAPELFARTWKTVASDSRPLPEVEKEIIGTDHCELGALLAQEWNLPEEITSGIRKHHTAQEAGAPNSMTGIIQIAEFIALKMDYGAMPSSQASLCTPLAGHVKDHLQEYRLLARDLPSRLAKARDLYEYQGG